LTAEQLEAARAERMRQNGHGAITIEDVRTWIEETGLAIFLPRSAQAGFTAPTFVEAVAGQRTTEPTLELIASAESLLVRLEAEGVAVRLNLAGQPGDQPDYVVAGWVLPYIYALRGDRDWRRSPQLTGSRQVSQLAVHAAKQLDTANLTATQIRDLLGRETTETAVLRALHELWKQLRIIPVVPEIGTPALWQPLRQRFQKAIAEGASTSQVTAISVLASIYLQAVIAASMEDVEMFLSPLTSRSKIREVVRGLAATRQVHSTNMGHSPMYYVAGTLPEFPAVPSFQISTSLPAYRSSNYRGSSYLPSYLDQAHEEEVVDFVPEIAARAVEEIPAAPVAPQRIAEPAAATPQHRKPMPRSTVPTKPAAPRPRSVSSTHPRERSRSAASSNGTRSGASGDRRAPAPRTAAGNGARSASGSSTTRNGFNNGTGHHKNGSNGSHLAKSNGAKSNGAVKNGNGSHANGSAKNGAHAKSDAASKTARPAWNARPAPHGSSKAAKAAPVRPGAKPATRPEARSNKHPASRSAASNGHSGHNAKAVSTGGHRSEGRNGANARPVAKSTARPASRSRVAEATKRTPATASAAKRYSFAGQAKQAPKPVAKRAAVAKAGAKAGAKSSRPAPSKRRG
jgi:23S rRNA pseudouridine2605 synthase